MNESVLTVDGLYTHFLLDEGTVRAVQGVSLTVPRGKTLAVVGESGCGKSVMAYSILQLVEPPGRRVAGRIVLHRTDGDVALHELRANGAAMRAIRGRDIAMVFQEPMTALSPVHRVGDQIVEAIRLHTRLNRREAREQAIQVMGQVGIPSPAQRIRQYPFEMSGGLRQRVVIAMALCCRPALLIADEPTTALDVTIQAQILDLLRGLQAERGMSLLLITHDLGVVAEIAHNVAVMYWGRIVERSTTQALLEAPLHPYTQGLLQSLPHRYAAGGRLKSIPGSVPGSFACVMGCPFHPRCPERMAGLCDVGDPPPLKTVAPDRQVACHRRESLV